MPKKSIDEDNEENLNMEIDTPDDNHGNRETWDDLSEHEEHDYSVGKSNNKIISKKNKASALQEMGRKSDRKDPKGNKKKDSASNNLGKKDNISVPGENEDENGENEIDSKFFVVRVSGGQESLIASTLQTKLVSKEITGIFSVIFLDNFKGYVIVEALDSHAAYEAMHGIRHIRGQIRGELPFKDIEGYLIKKPVVTELTIDDTVEIIAGPFKSMKAKIMRVDYEKQEATVVLLDSPYQIPVTVDANYLKKSL
jgi:transcriptional antiterminator NusG